MFRPLPKLVHPQRVHTQAELEARKSSSEAAAAPRSTFVPPW
jgi:hypothetical protein